MILVILLVFWYCAYWSREWYKSIDDENEENDCTEGRSIDEMILILLWKYSSIEMLLWYSWYWRYVVLLCDIFYSMILLVWNDILL